MILKTIDDICEVIAGQSPPSSTYNSKKNGLPFYQGKSDFGEHYPEPRLWCSDPQKIAVENDILISVRAPVGPTNICKERSCIGRGLSAIRAKKNTYYKYVYYYLKTIERKFSDQGRGSTFQSITQTDIKNIQIPIPNEFEEQKRIAEILDKANSIRQKRRETLRLADEFLRSTFLEMFGDPYYNPRNYKIVEVGDIVKEVKYGTSKPAVENGKYKYLRMNNITYEGRMDLKDLKYIDIEDDQKEKYLVRKGDLLFNRTNSKELVGKTAVFKEDEEMIIAGYLLRVRTNELANPDFLSAYLNSNYGKKVLSNMCKNIIGMANINAQEFQSIKIYLPPIKLQNKFAVIVEKTEQLKRKYEQSLQESENLFNSLMQRAFRGEL